MSARRGMIVPSLFALLGLLVLIGLGTWQMERLAWKEDLIATLSRRLAADPVELPLPAAWANLTPGSSEFLRVKLRADFRSDGALVYTSGSALRDDVKSPGYFVFMAGRLPSGDQVVVNRGYARDRTFPMPAGPHEVSGILRWPEAASWFVADHDRASDVWHVRDQSLMASVKGWGAVAPFYVEQEAPPPPGGVPHPARLKVNLPNNHLQYAVTWYGLALVLIVVFAFWAGSRRREMR